MVLPWAGPSPHLPCVAQRQYCPPLSFVRSPHSFPEKRGLSRGFHQGLHERRAFSAAYTTSAHRSLSSSRLQASRPHRRRMACRWTATPWSLDRDYPRLRNTIRLGCVRGEKAEWKDLWASSWLRILRSTLTLSSAPLQASTASLSAET